MNLFKRGKQSNEPATTTAVFDVRPRSVGVALVDTSGDWPNVLWSKRQQTRLRQYDHDDLYYRAIQPVVEALLKDLDKVGRASLRSTTGSDYIHTIKFIFSSPWSVDQVVSSRVSQPRQFILNRDHIYSAGRLAYNDFSHEDDHNLFPLSQRIIALHGDGRLIRYPHETPIRELNLRMHVSKLPRAIKQSLEKIVGAYHHPEKISFHSSTDVANRVFSRAFEHPTDFLVVIPEYTQTDIVFVQDGRLEGVASFPIGEDFLLQAMSQAFSRPVADVRSRLQLYHQGRLSQEVRNIEIALEEIGRRWSASFTEAVNGLSETPPIYNYLLTEDREYKPAFESFFSNTFESIPDIQSYVVDNDLFTDYFLEDGGIDCTLAVSVLGVEVY
jgi:hypothetical protein